MIPSPLDGHWNDEEEGPPSLTDMRLISESSDEQMATFAFRAAEHLVAQLPRESKQLDHMARLTGLARDMVYMDATVVEDAMSPKTGRSMNFGSISDIDTGVIEDQRDLDAFLPGIHELDVEWNDFTREVSVHVPYARFFKHREMQRAMLDAQHLTLAGRLKELMQSEKDMKDEIELLKEENHVLDVKSKLTERVEHMGDQRYDGAMRVLKNANLDLDKMHALNTVYRNDSGSQVKQVAKDKRKAINADQSKLVDTLFLLKGTREHQVTLRRVAGETNVERANLRTQVTDLDHATTLPTLATIPTQTLLTRRIPKVLLIMLTC
jgi:hypothetical protein